MRGGSSVQERQALKSTRLVLPGGRDTDEVVAVDIVPVVDAETVGIKETDEDTVAVRIATGGTNVTVREQVNATDRLVGRHDPRRFRGVGDDTGRLHEHFLLLPGLVERALDRFLAERDPDTRLNLVLAGELLLRIVIPARIAFVRPLRAESAGPAPE